MGKYVALDIGHGENTFDNGSKGVIRNGQRFEEHHANCAIALHAERRLKELGFRTIFGQQPYQNDVTLANRSALYNREKVDLVVSIHANAGTASATGFGVFHWHTANGSKQFAELVLKQYKETAKGVGVWGTGVHRSVPKTWSDFHIVSETHMDAVLCEFGFMTNDNDFQYIFGQFSVEYHKQCAESIVKAICEYYGVAYKEESSPAPTVPTPQEVNGGNYKIKAGDTFYSIARDAGISVQDIQRANPTVNARALQVGTYIVVPVAHQAPKGDQDTNSIVTYLNSIGVDSSFSNRAKLASQHGIAGYKGTASQNLLLLKKVRGH